MVRPLQICLCLIESAVWNRLAERDDKFISFLLEQFIHKEDHSEVELQLQCTAQPAEEEIPLGIMS